MRTQKDGCQVDWRVAREGVFFCLNTKFQRSIRNYANTSVMTWFGCDYFHGHSVKIGLSPEEFPFG
jgi:hypothetical protein